MSKCSAQAQSTIRPSSWSASVFIPLAKKRAPHTPHTACSLYTHYGTRCAQKTLPILTRAATNTRTAKFEKQKRYSRTSKTKADATRYNKGA